MAAGVKKSSVKKYLSAHMFCYFLINKYISKSINTRKKGVGAYNNKCF